MSALALIAGQGRLPRLIAGRLRGAGERVSVFSLEGFVPEGVASESFRIEHLGTLLRQLREAGFDRLCLAGAVRRPRLDPALVDAESAGAVARIAGAFGRGDDALLRVVVQIFEEAGLRVVGAHELLPSLLAVEGPSPGGQLALDAARGRAVLDALGPLDLGQGCVVAQGQVLAIETLPGTEAMLAFVARTRVPGSKGGVFVKRAKPGQDLRVDMPAIGPDTVEQALAAGLSGICLQAGHVLLLDRDLIEEKARASGLALWAEP